MLPLQLPHDSIDTFAVQEFLEKTLTGASEKIDGQDSPHKTYYEDLLKKVSQDPQTALQLYNEVTQLEIQPELIAILDNNLPSLRTEVIAFYKIGIPLDENMTLEELIRKKINMRDKN